MKYLLPLLLLLPGLHASAQNLVPNGSFEQSNACPSNYGQVFYAYPWKVFAAGDADYFHSCNTFNYGVPQNLTGNQAAADGIAYTGILTYYGNVNYKEYIKTPITHVQPYGKYEVSLSVSLAESSGWGSNDFGVFFYDKGPDTISTMAVLPVTPQVTFPNYGNIINKSAWIRLIDTFVADSAYDNIVIGGFTPFNSMSPTVVTGGGLLSNAAYYYIDSVVIRTLDTLQVGFADTLLCGTDSILVPYHAMDSIFHTGNVFIIQLSDNSGSFATPLNIGSKSDTVSGTIKIGLPSTLTPGNGYRMRIVATNISYISHDNGKDISVGMTLPAKPVATSNSPVCSGNNINLSASTASSSITAWHWLGPRHSSSSQNTFIGNSAIADSGNYIVTVFKYGCIARDTEWVIVKPSPSAIVASSNYPVCATDTIKLSASNSAGTSYSWSGPGSYSSTLQKPIITPASASQSGTYTAMATASNGCTASASVIVTVQPMPALPNATNNGPVCSGDSLKLFATTTTAGVNYGWAGPVSYSSTLQNATRASTTVAHSGVYTLTTNLNGCKTIDTTHVLINQSPAKPVAANSGPVCEGITFNLLATNTTSGATYAWSGPASYTASTANASRTGTVPGHSGNYIVTATLNGCDRKDTTNVIVKPLPAIPVLTSNSPLCPGDSLGLAATSTAGVVYQWMGPNSYTSIQQNPYILNVNTAHSGSYNVTATLNGCSNSNSTTVLVNQTPATPVPASNSPVCPNTPINLSASNISGATYNWSGPVAYSSTLQNPVINNATVSQAGSYSVTATVNGCVSLTGTTNVVVATPAASYTAGSNSPVCAGGIINLNASNTPGGVWTWSGPNGFSSAAQNPSIAPAPLNGGGSYSVYATLNGCQYPAVTTNVVVNNVSSLGIYPSPNGTLCINNANANFVAVPFNAGSAPQYQWYKNNNLIGGATNISYPAGGIANGDSFYCQMTVTGLCADPLILYSNKVGMTVLPLTAGPTLTISADPGTLLSPWQLVKFTAVATNAGAVPKYQWKRNGQDVIGATSNVWSANNLSNGDTISCVVTSGVWCASPASEMSNRMVVNIKTGIKDIDGGDELRLYPNPNNGSFVVYLPLTPSRGGHVSVDVVDALRRTVYSNFEIPNSKVEVTLPASVANGVYMLKLQADGVMYHARFTVSR